MRKLFIVLCFAHASLSAVFLPVSQKMASRSYHRIFQKFAVHARMIQHSKNVSNEIKPAHPVHDTVTKDASLLAQFFKKMYPASKLQEASQVIEEQAGMPLLSNQQAIQQTKTLPFGKSHATIYNNYYYGPKGFSTHLFEWLEHGKQTRAVGVGFFVGVCTSAVACAFLSKKDTQEKIIVIQQQASDEHK